MKCIGPTFSQDELAAGLSLFGSTTRLKNIPDILGLRQT